MGFLVKRSELEALRDALRYIVQADATSYSYGDPRADGTPAPKGTRWLTPKERALAALANSEPIGRLNR